MNALIAMRDALRFFREIHDMEAASELADRVQDFLDSIERED